RRRPTDRSRTDGLEIVAIERDIDHSLRYVLRVTRADHANETGSQLHSASLDADNDETVSPVIQLDDFVRDAAQRSGERARVENRARLGCHRREKYGQSRPRSLVETMENR